MFGETRPVTINLPGDFVEALELIAEESHLSLPLLLLSELDKTKLFKIARQVRSTNNQYIAT